MQGFNFSRDSIVNLVRPRRLAARPPMIIPSTSSCCKSWQTLSRAGDRGLSRIFLGLMLHSCCLQLAPQCVWHFSLFKKILRSCDFPNRKGLLEQKFRRRFSNFLIFSVGNKIPSIVVNVNVLFKHFFLTHFSSLVIVVRSKTDPQLITSVEAIKRSF